MKNNVMNVILAILIIAAIAVAVYFTKNPGLAPAGPRCAAEESFKVCAGGTYCKCTSIIGTFVWGYPSSGNCADNAPPGCTDAPTVHQIVDDETELALCALAEAGVAPKDPQCPVFTLPNGKSCVARGEDYVTTEVNLPCCTAFKIANCVLVSQNQATP